MEEQIYQDMIVQQEKHWWFKARKDILNSILKTYTSKEKIKILEVGCGTGGNISMLKQYGNGHVCFRIC